MPKNTDFLQTKNSGISKMCVYLRATFHVSSIILTSFRQDEGGPILTPPPSPQNESLKSPPRLGLSSLSETRRDVIYVLTSKTYLAIL